MPSKDFIYDLLEKLEEDGQQYVVLLPQEGEKKTQVDVYYALNTENSIGASINIMKKISKELEKDLPNRFDPDDWDTDDYEELWITIWKPQ